MTENELKAVRAEVEKTLRALDVFYQATVAGPRLPGDVDVEQLMTYWNCSDETVRVRMRAAVRSGKFMTCVVWDPEKKLRLRVWRVKETPPG